MSAANEKAVEVFLAGKIGYLDIVPLVEATCEAHVPELKVITLLQPLPWSPSCPVYSAYCGPARHSTTFTVKLEP